MPPKFGKSKSAPVDSSVYDLPKFEECLFGPTGICPRVTDASKSAAAAAAKQKAAKKNNNLSSFLERNGETDEESGVDNDVGNHIGNVANNHIDIDNDIMESTDPTQTMPTTSTSTDSSELRVSDDDTEIDPAPPVPKRTSAKLLKDFGQLSISYTAADSATDDATNNQNNDNAFEDDIAAGHWAEVASTALRLPRIDPFHSHYGDDYNPNDHTINLNQLRALASQGIPDEGSFRALAWRVLLGLVPYRKIHSTWSKCLQEQRKMYKALCHEYFCNPIDGGRHLRGTWTKKLRNCTKQQRQKYINSIQRLDEDEDGDDDDATGYATDEDYEDNNFKQGHFNDRRSSTTSDSLNGGGSIHTTNYDDSEAGASDTKNRQRRRSYSYYRSIDAQLAPKLREQWEKTGLSSSLDAHSVSKPFSTSPQKNRRRNRSEQRRQSQDGGNGGNNNNNSNNDGDNGAGGASPSQTSSHSMTTDNTLSRKTVRGLSQNQLAVPKALQRNATATPSAMSDFLEMARSLASIRKDTVRTHPDLYFYLEPDQNLGLRRYAALERILFIWARLNKGVRYVQGMNEIVGTVFYVLANDANADWAKHAEADTYWLFDILMRELRDVYIPDKDHDDDGIHARLEDIETLLSTHDPQVQQHLHGMGINSSLYAIRWVTTLLSREFLLPDTIRLWDSIFASTQKEDFLRYVCVTMVMMIRSELLKGDFSQCLQVLHNYPSQNVDQLLESSKALQEYELQINHICERSKHDNSSRIFRGGMSIHQALQTIPTPPFLVMAFGFPGGVIASAYRSASIARADAEANANHNSAGGGGGGLLGFGLAGKAKKLWTGWKDTNSQSESLIPIVSEDATPTASAKGSIIASANKNDSHIDVTIDDRQFNTAATFKPQLPVQIPPPSRHWKRGKSEPARHTNNTGNDPAGSGSRPRFWNRTQSSIVNNSNNPANGADANTGNITQDPSTSNTALKAGDEMNPDLIPAGPPSRSAVTTIASAPSKSDALLPAASASYQKPSSSRIWMRGRSQLSNNAPISITSSSDSLQDTSTAGGSNNENRQELQESGGPIGGGRVAGPSRLWNRKRGNAAAPPSVPNFEGPNSGAMGLDPDRAEREKSRSEGETISLPSLSSLPSDVSERVSRDIFEILSS